MGIFHKRVVLIYGDSILLTGLAETLRAQTQWTVGVQSTGFTLPAGLAPDLVVVDDAQTTPSQVADLLSVFPPNHSPPILSLNLEAQRLTVFSTQQFPAASLDDLAQALEYIAAKPK